VWQGGPAGDAVELPITLGPMPEAEQRLQFKVLQTYDDGEIVRWIDDWPAGAPEPANPGPVLDVVVGGPGEVPDASATTAPTTTGATVATTASTAPGASSTATSAPSATTTATTSTATTATTAAPTTATVSTTSTGGDDGGSNTWAFVAVGAMLLAVGGLVWRSARRPSQ
jgi:hypothetical protein